MEGQSARSKYKLVALVSAHTIFAGRQPESALLHFDWDEHNIAHIARNVGETASGRILVVVTTQVGEKLRVVTAFKARKVLQELYSRRRYRKV